MEIRKTELLGWLPVLADAARTAGQAILQVYATDFAVRGKGRRLAGDRGRRAC
ncbi:MAG: hypothetical protein IPN37_11835 [Betaproteobacteria bacterium]|nr:hypothetical protein [Betaproteobacteria bacterium]